MVAYQIYRDPQQPRIHTAFAAEAHHTLIHAQKTFLRDRVGGILVFHHQQNVAVDSFLVLPHDGFERYGRYGLRSTFDRWAQSCRQCSVHEFAATLTDEFDARRFTRLIGLKL